MKRYTEHQFDLLFKYGYYKIKLKHKVMKTLVNIFTALLGLACFITWQTAILFGVIRWILNYPKRIKQETKALEKQLEIMDSLHAESMAMISKNNEIIKHFNTLSGELETAMDRSNEVILTHFSRMNEVNRILTDITKN